MDLCHTLIIIFRHFAAQFYAIFAGWILLRRYFIITASA